MLASNDPGSVFETLGRELRGLELNCTYTSVDQAAGLAVIEYFSLDSKLLQAIQKITKTTISGFIIPEERWTPEAIQVAKDGRPAFVPNYIQSIRPLFARIEGPLLDQGLKLAGITEDTKGVYLPMQLGTEAVGFLNIWGEKLRETDVPAFKVFAAQISSILEKARHYEAEHKQAEELERSNALVSALGRVAAQVASGNQLDVVLDTLGEELKSLGISFSYSVIDKERETEIIQHYSLELQSLESNPKVGGNLII